MTPQLPPALQAILPVLAADQGRTRARTLLFIAVVGPDLVDSNIAGLDAALGTSSPGPAGLASLVSAVKTASSASSPTIIRQHVITQAVLRCFCEPGAGNAGQQLMRYDLRYGTSRPNGPGGVGYVRDFVKIDSDATERLWQQVENNLTSAIDSAISQATPPAPGLISVLRDAIALHYVRNPQSLEVHEQAFAGTFDKVADTLAQTPAAAEAFRRQRGLEPAGPEARRLGAEELFAPMRHASDQGALFRLRVQDLYETVRDHFQGSGVQILIPAAGSELLIGDTPALTVDLASGTAGVRAGVSLTAASTIMLPLAPRLLVALGPATVTAQVPPGFVDLVNHVQVQAAQQYVLHRLRNANFSMRIAAWRNTPASAFTWPVT